MTHGYQRKASPPWETATKAAVSKAEHSQKSSLRCLMETRVPVAFHVHDTRWQQNPGRRGLLQTPGIHSQRNLTTEGMFWGWMDNREEIPPTENFYQIYKL